MMTVTLQEITIRPFWKELIQHHVNSTDKLEDSYEIDDTYQSSRWCVRMWYDIAEYILMAFPDEDLLETINKIESIETQALGHSDYVDKFSLYISEYVMELYQKYNV